MVSFYIFWHDVRNDSRGDYYAMYTLINKKKNITRRVERERDIDIYYKKTSIVMHSF